MSQHATQQQLHDAVAQLPAELWDDALAMLERLNADDGATADQPIRTGQDLVDSALIGIWSDHSSIGSSQEYGRQLRHQASHRAIKGKSDAAGH